MFVASDTGPRDFAPLRSLTRDRERFVCRESSSRLSASVMEP